MLLLDTPDIDSDAPVNWQRADIIRQASDVLIAVLTQQKYNDAAVKQFFRKAAEADKPIIVVFNQCDLHADREYWPLWLQTFAEEIAARPELVYVVPYDRQGAAERRLRFFSVGAGGRKPPVESSLADELAALHFDMIKIRTFRADSRICWIAETAHRPTWNEFAIAPASFPLPARRWPPANWCGCRGPCCLRSRWSTKFAAWWDAGAPPGRAAYTVRIARSGKGSAGRLPPHGGRSRSTGRSLAIFHVRERDAIVEAVEKLLDELDRLPHGERNAASPARSDLVRQLALHSFGTHRSGPLPAAGHRRALSRDAPRGTRSLGGRQPRAVTFLQSLDHATAIARPAITVVLLVTGTFVGSEMVGQTAMHLAGHTAGNLAAEAAIAGGITVGGEAVVTATGEGVRQAAAPAAGCKPAMPSHARHGWPAGSIANCWADCSTTFGKGRRQRSPAFRDVTAALAACAISVTERGVRGSVPREDEFGTKPSLVRPPGEDSATSRDAAHLAFTLDRHWLALWSVALCALWRNNTPRENGAS